MTLANDLHNEAMDAAFFAKRARTRGDTEEAARLFREALHGELAAIADLENSGQMDQLTNSIMHRSAGTLALDCKDYRLAEQLAAKALVQDPHPAIAWELRELLEQVYFHWNLDRNGVALGDDEIQMSLVGQEVGYGVVSHKEMFGRVEASSQLIYRIVERRTNRAFREKGQPAKEIQSGYQPFVSALSPGSFSVTLKLGNPADQSISPVMPTSAEVVDEFLDLMALVNRANFSEIQERIPDPAYLRNFYRLAKKIAPDGKRISRVGFTQSRGDEKRYVEFDYPASEILPPPIGNRADDDD